MSEHPAPPLADLAGTQPRVARAIADLLPADAADLAPLLLGSLGGPRSGAIDRARVQQLFLDPIREIVQRGGKCWRSLLLEACCEAVGGDFTPFEPLLALPELVHVGSLIVDDVQDASAVRRGGPSCHDVHGVALAVNAGTGAYFLGEHVLSQAPLSLARRDRIRTLMFEAFRAGHAGQALDIGGFDPLVDDVLGGRAAPERLREQVEVVHWLKAALPAAAFARVGCVLAGEDGPRADAVGAYVEAVGMGFQAIDDVLNLRGFASDLKQRGEDLRDGKLTLPVAVAIERLGPSEGEALWRRIAARPRDPEEVAALIACIEDCGALDEVERESIAAVEVAWSAVRPHVAGRGADALRRLGVVLLRRHY